MFQVQPTVYQQQPDDAYQSDACDMSQDATYNGSDTWEDDRLEKGENAKGSGSSSGSTNGSFSDQTQTLLNKVCYCFLILIG